MKPCSMHRPSLRCRDSRVSRPPCSNPGPPRRWCSDYRAREDHPRGSCRGDPGGVGRGTLVLTSSRTAASDLRNRITAARGRVVATGGDDGACAVPGVVAALRRTSRPAPAGCTRAGVPGAGAPARRRALSLAAALRPALATRGFASQVRAPSRGPGSWDWTRGSGPVRAAADRPEWTALGGFFAEYLDVLDAEGVLDYAEPVHRVRLLLADLSIAAAVTAESGPFWWMTIPNSTPPRSG